MYKRIEVQMTDEQWGQFEVATAEVSKDGSTWIAIGQPIMKRRVFVIGVASARPERVERCHDLVAQLVKVMKGEADA